MTTPSDDEGSFDILILGTGLTESITAAALSKAGYKVVQVDTNPYYGAQHASLTLEELDLWAERHPHAFRVPGDLPGHSRAYSVSLTPTILPSTGPMISSLVASGVAKYGGYRLVQKVGVYTGNGIVRLVPSSKEDVFNDESISLLDKRRLMRFLLFASGEFEDKNELVGKEGHEFVEWLKTTWNLNDELVDAIAYALAYCTSPTEKTLPALQRVRQHLRSSGRYGSSPFILAHYGGSGEICQGFCRTSAVAGGVYILGRGIESLHTYSTPRNTERFGLRMTEFPADLTADVLIASQEYTHYFPLQWKSALETSSDELVIARCVAVIDRPLAFGNSILQDQSQEEALEGPSAEELDTGVLIIPPKSITDRIDASATVLVTGEGSMSAPKGKYIVHIALPVTSLATKPQEILEPYLTAVLSLCKPPDPPVTPLYTLFYHDVIRPTTPPVTRDRVLLTPPIWPHLTSTLDNATERAEELFRLALSKLKEAGVKSSLDSEDNEEVPFWPQIPVEEEDDEW